MVIVVICDFAVFPTAIIFSNQISYGWKKIIACFTRFTRINVKFSRVPVHYFCKNPYQREEESGKAIQLTTNPQNLIEI